MGKMGKREKWGKQGNGEKRGKRGNGDGDGETSPQNSPIPIFPKWGNGEGWGKVLKVGMGMGGPISIPIPQMLIPMCWRLLFL